MRRVVTVLTVTLLMMTASACGAQTTQPGSTAATPASSAHEPAVTTQEATQELPDPTGEARTEELPGGGLRFWPTSQPVEKETPYRMTVYTHCGLDYKFDFDGSLWVLAETPSNGSTAFNDPEDDGVVELRADDVAVYRSSRNVEFTLQRLPGPKDIPGLCA